MCLLKSRSQYLDCVLESYSMKHVQETKIALANKGEFVKSALSNHFELPQKYHPITSGSLVKKTAINTKFDLDIVVPFPVDHFGNLEQMASGITRFFQEEYRTLDPQLKNIRANQRWSVGLFFEVPVKGKGKQQVQIDIVPGMEVRRGAYLHDQRLWLKNKDEGHRIQTNIHKQIAHLKQAPQGVREIVRLLKIWRNYSSGPKIKSFALELLVIQAFEQCNGKLPKGRWNQLKMVLEHIERKRKKLKLIDPGNTNNHVHALMTGQSKASIADIAAKMIHKVEANANHLREYFPDQRKYCLSQKY